MAGRVTPSATSSSPAGTSTAPAQPHPRGPRPARRGVTTSDPDGTEAVRARREERALEERRQPRTSNASRTVVIAALEGVPGPAPWSIWGAERGGSCGPCSSPGRGPGGPSTEDRSAWTSRLRALEYRPGSQAEARPLAPPMQRERIELVQGSLTYRDGRASSGFDAACPGRGDRAPRPRPRLGQPSSGWSSSFARPRRRSS